MSCVPQRTEPIIWVWPHQHTSKQTEECEPRGGRWYDKNAVRRLEGGDTLHLESLFGEVAPEAYDSAVKLAFKDLSSDGWNCPEPQEYDYDLGSWSIGHSRGAWRAVAEHNAASGECELRHEMEVILPDSITGGAAPQVDWTGVSAQLPGVKDWFVSPDRAYGAAVFEDVPGTFRLAIYSLMHGAPGTRLLNLPLGLMEGGPVLVNWGTAAELEKWQAAIRTGG